MSLSRTVSSSLRCTACAKPITRALPRTTSHGSVLRASWTTPSTSFQRSFSSTVRTSADRDDPAVQDPEYALLDEQDATKSISEEELEAAPSQFAEDIEKTTSESIHVSSDSPTLESESAPLDSEATPAAAPITPQSTLPWYLQNRAAPEPTQAAIIPDLPPNPPPLLSTILEYIANTAGMDDLLLYDLRYLDPPPALGSSLIMLICTARSEKHLHVSADRFCRYLRREHHLRANAAGLLGRNELKIKLRRKAKRMKMLANVGGAEPEGNLDDGIRTGWICCTLGKIQAHPDDKGIVGARGDGEGFVGFSDVKPGVNVVVQMFTDEKRNEIDLETLWSGVIKTHARNDEKAENMIKALEEDVEEADLEAEVAEEERIQQKEKEEKEAARPEPPSTPTFQFSKTRPTVGDVFPPPESFDNRQQLRRLHTVGLRGYVL